MKKKAEKICPVCGGTSYKQHHVPWAYGKAGEERNWIYDRCRVCGVAWLDAMKKWTPEDYATKVYDENYHLCDREYDGTRSKNLLPGLMNFLNWRKRNPKVLDYGGGTGIMADLLRQQGIEAYTYDPYDKQDENALEQKYDAVTAIEVLEHDIHPHELFEAIGNLLAPDGVFISTTDFIGRNDVENWFYANPRAGHCLLWTQEALDYIAIHHGLHPLRHSGNWHLYERMT